MKSKLILLSLALTLAACVTPPKPTYNYQTSNTISDEAKKIYEIAIKCWSKDFSLFQDRVIVESMIEINGAVITARRAAPDIGYQVPFIRIVVSEVSSGTSVIVEEGDFAIGSYENLTQDVKRWSGGDLTCNKT